jgi:hypothetical protein
LNSRISNIERRTAEVQDCFINPVPYDSRVDENQARRVNSAIVRHRITTKHKPSAVQYSVFDILLFILRSFS